MRRPKISRRVETRPYGRVSTPTGNCRKFLTQLRQLAVRGSPRGSRKPNSWQTRRAIAVRPASDPEASNDRMRSSPTGDCNVERIDTEEYTRQACQMQNKKSSCTYV